MPASVVQQVANLFSTELPGFICALMDVDYPGGAALGSVLGDPGHLIWGPTQLAQNALEQRHGMPSGRRARLNICVLEGLICREEVVRRLADSQCAEILRDALPPSCVAEAREDG